MLYWIQEGSLWEKNFKVNHVVVDLNLFNIHIVNMNNLVFYNKVHLWFHFNLLSLLLLFSIFKIIKPCLFNFLYLLVRFINLFQLITDLIEKSFPAKWLNIILTVRQDSSDTCLRLLLLIWTQESQFAHIDRNLDKLWCSHTAAVHLHRYHWCRWF